MRGQMYLNDLSAPEGASKRRKVVGRGPGSGHGKTSCRGHKGQKSRAGYSSTPGFEGGQMPLHRRLPKRGFSNFKFKKRYEIVNLSQLGGFEAGTTINPQLLKEQGLIKGVGAGVKILSDGELNVKLNIEAHRFSKSAIAKIEQAQGTWNEIK